LWCRSFYLSGRAVGLTETHSVLEKRVADTIDITPVDRLDITVERWSWPFAVERRAEIDRYFAERQRGQDIWNGRVMLLSRYVIDDGILHGSCFETDFASFLAWRAWGFPDRGIFNVFAAMALRSVDGAYLLGEMAPSTANAGMVYFPCGTPDPSDIADGMLDLTESASRELREETGLDIGALDAEPGWTAVRDGGYLAVIKRAAATETAPALRAKILRHVAEDPHPEFADVRIVAGRSDVDAQIPRWAAAYLENAWQREQAGGVARR
jgi:8-oxo-dGTP pyrophosphatase MutT (NUDIX family)